MPLEVREIGIRMAVGDGDGEEEAGTQAAADARGGLDPCERRAIVEECVRSVLAELRMGRER